MLKNLEDALKTKEFLLKKFPNCKDIYIFEIGSIIGSHTGKNSVAVSFVEINKSLQSIKELSFLKYFI